MAKAFSLPINPELVVIAPSVSESRAKFAYVDGQRSNSPALSASGKPLFSFTGIAEINGQRLGEVRVESTVELPASLPLGTLLKVTGPVELRVRPEDNYSVAITLAVEGIAPMRAGRSE